MSEDSKTSGHPDQASGDEQGSKDTVAYSSYQKLLTEKKAEKAKREAMEAQLRDLQEKALAEQSQFKELYEKTKQEKDQLVDSLKKTKSQFAYQLFEKEAKRVAVEMGVRPEAADDFIKVADFQGVEVDPETFTVDPDRLKEAVARTQKSKGYLFKEKSAASPKDVTLGNGAIPSKPISELSSSDIEKLLKSGAFN